MSHLVQFSRSAGIAGFVSWSDGICYGHGKEGLPDGHHGDFHHTGNNQQHSRQGSDRTEIEQRGSPGQDCTGDCHGV